MDGEDIETGAAALLTAAHEVSDSGGDSKYESAIQKVSTVVGSNVMSEDIRISKASLGYEKPEIAADNDEEKNIKEEDPLLETKS